MITPYPIYLLRHGQTEWNVEARLQGRLDSVLTERGVRQARNMGATIASLLDRSLDWQLVASPQPRAWNTALIVSGLCGRAPEADDRLREASMGLWEGLNGTEIDASWPNLTGVYRFLQAPEGETQTEVSGRARLWLESILQPTIAISHGVTGRVLRALYLGIDPQDIPSSAGVNQDGFFHLDQGKVNFIKCIEHNDEHSSNLPPAPRRNRVEP